MVKLLSRKITRIKENTPVTAQARWSAKYMNRKE